MLSETTYTIGPDGGLEIPREILAEMGLYTGNTVRVAYLSADGRKNSFREFMLTPDGIANAESDEHIAVPAALLEQANIPEDADVQVVCGKGAIILSADPVLHADELQDILTAMEVASDILSQLPYEPEDAIDSLRNGLNKEGANDNDESE